MKNFITLIAVILAAIWVITFIMYPSDIPVHITLAVVLIVAILGAIKMKKIGKV